MLVSEAEWIQSVLANHFKEEDFPLLNVGSSNLEFRSKVQPHIEQLIFNPLREKGYQFFHVDLKDDEGVDLIGDLNDADFRKKLQELGINSVLCSNLLEHLENPQLIIDAILNLLDVGGKIIITVPYQFPYHKDPIDTMFRPSPDELHKMFPNTRVIQKDIVNEDLSFYNDLMSNKKYALKMTIRWCLPFYKYNDWKHMVKSLKHLRAKYSASVILLEKTA